MATIMFIVKKAKLILNEYQKLFESVLKKHQDNDNSCMSEDLLQTYNNSLVGIGNY